MQKHDLQPKNGFWSSIFEVKMKDVRDIVIILSIVIMIMSIWVYTPPGFIPNKNTPIQSNSQNPDSGTVTGLASLGIKISDENSVAIEVEPINFEKNSPINFKISLNTHSVSLDFDLTEISTLEDDQGNVYEPVSWDGSPSGGHHRSGTLKFPVLDNGAKTMKLTINGVAEIPERVFEWTI